MIWEIDTSKIPDKQIELWAELILLSKKFNCTIDESINDMRSILNNKSKEKSMKINKNVFNKKNKFLEVCYEKEFNQVSNRYTRTCSTYYIDYNGKV